MIRLSKLTKAFGRRTVLDRLELSVERGERLALVGSNGAGKTTMIRCLLGQYTHDGVVTVDGLSPRAARDQVLAKIGFVPQLPPPLKLPVGELLRFSAALSGTTVARIAQVASRLGLDSTAVASQPFFKLSGGQKQKLLIAIALGREAELLLMDEPAANLDPDARAVFFGLLAERADPCTMLISSHRLDEVAALVNRVVELDRGQVVLDDRVADAPLNGRLECRVRLRRPDEAIARALREWRFTPAEDGLTWAGEVAGADRLRLMGVLSRYVGLLTLVCIEERHEAQLKVVSS